MFIFSVFHGKTQSLRKVTYVLLCFIIIIYCFAFVLRGFNEFYDEKMDFIRGTRILERGLEGFYDEDVRISPYPPLALILIALFRMFFPTLILFKLAFLAVHALDWIIFYIILRRMNYELAPFIMLILSVFPLLRLGLITLHPTDYLFLLFLLLSICFYPKSKTTSLLFLGLSIATKWYTILASLFLPCFYYKHGRKEFMFKSALILWSSILIGLVMPIIIFPNYLNIYMFHAEKAGKIVSWITYSYGFKVPVINLPDHVADVASYILIVFGLLISLVIISKYKPVYSSILAFSLIPFILFLIAKQPSLRFCTYPLIVTSLIIKKKFLLILSFLTLAFFFRTGFIQALIVLLTLLYINYKLA